MLFLVMKKVLQGAFLPFVIFASGMLLLGCDQAQDHATEQEKTEIAEQASNQNIEQQESDIAPNKTELKKWQHFLYGPRCC